MILFLVLLRLYEMVSLPLSTLLSPEFRAFFNTDQWKAISIVIDSISMFVIEMLEKIIKESHFQITEYDGSDSFSSKIFTGVFTLFCGDPTAVEIAGRLPVCMAEVFDLDKGLFLFDSIKVIVQARFGVQIGELWGATIEVLPEFKAIVETDQFKRLLSSVCESQ